MKILCSIHWNRERHPEPDTEYFNDREKNPLTLTYISEITLAQTWVKKSQSRKSASVIRTRDHYFC